MRAGAESDARQATIQVDAAAAYDRMLTFETGARVTAGIGGGLALIGASMLIVDLLVVDQDADVAERVGVACSPSGCEVGARF